MDPVVTTYVVGFTFAASVAAVESLYDFYQNRISEKVRETVAKMKHYVNLDSMNEYDKQKVAETKALLEEVFGKPIQKQIGKLGSEERIKKLYEFSVRAAELYGVTIDKISVEESNHIYGAYLKDKKEIVLNRACFLSDNWDIQREMLDTIIHEYRHAVQFAVLDQIDRLSEDASKNPWHVSMEKAKRWSYHYLDYAEACKIPMEYSTNQLEVDARTFAYICLEGV